MPARQHRVTRGDDYRRIVRKGYRVGGAFCITHAVLRVQASECAENESPVMQQARFGFIVSKAVGGAVMRNLIRRRFKTIVEHRINQGFTQVDVVFRALPAVATASFEDLSAEVNRALDRVERLISEKKSAEKQ